MSDPIRSAPGQKWLIVGQNGSGKTVLASSLGRAMQGGYPSLVVYDPKNDPGAWLPNLAELHTARDVARALPGHVLYRPDRADMAAIELRWDQICERLLILARAGAGGAGLVVHEGADLATADRIGPGWAEVIRQGRSLHLSPIVATQRPLGIPVLYRSEAQHVAAFTLVSPADRAEMAAIMGPAVRPAPLPLDFTWWYRGPDLRLRRMAPIAWTGGAADAAMDART
jgi:energy-coupling factor transporter ATP-binding protein EcfA2